MKRVFLLTAAGVFLAATPQAQAGPGSEAAGPRLFQRVVVDPGHGGHDTGAVNARGTAEKELVLEMARAVRDELARSGLDVRMTREDDAFIPLDDRARLANDWGADLLVSIHANAAESSGLKGFEVYTLSEETDDVERARARLGNSPDKTLDVILWDLRARENRRRSARVAERISTRVARYGPVEAKRLKSANFRVLKNADCPAVLVEMGYLTNLRDRSRLERQDYRRSMAGAIADGILLFKREYDQTDGFSR